MNLLNKYQVLGISHRESSVEIRSRYHLAGVREESMYDKLLQNHFFRGMILSTCNRTEVYFSGVHPSVVLEAWSEIAGNAIQQTKGLYCHRGQNCIYHLMQVTSGADSQILGDEEITGQIRKAYKNAKALGCVSGVWEKILNVSIATSRKIKRQTSFNEGSLSIGFEISRLLNQFKSNHRKNVLIIGAGDMSRNIVKNLSKYNPDLQLRLINRTRRKAEDIGKIPDIEILEWSDLENALARHEVVISAIQSQEFTLKVPSQEGNATRLIVDLGIPRNFAEPSMKCRKTKYLDIESISRRTAAQMKTRRTELPKVHRIMDKELHKFLSWNSRRPVKIEKENRERTFQHAETADC